MPPGAKGRAILFILLTFAFSQWMVKILWVHLLLAILCCLLIFMIHLPVVDEEQEKC